MEKESEFDKLNGLLDYYSRLTELQLVNLMHLKKAKLRRVQSPERDRTETPYQATKEDEDRDRTETHLIAIYRAIKLKK